MTVVSLVQLAVSDDEAPATRAARVADLVRGQAGTDVVVLPELWHVGAFALDRAREFAEPIRGPLIQAMRTAAKDAAVWLHAGSFAELDRASSRRYNTSVLISPDGQIAARYRKMHLFGWEDGEPSVMTAGTEFSVAETPLGATGLATCYDLRFPELFRGLVDRGATAILLTSGWPDRRIAHWTVLAQARAIENQVWFFGCNTSGTHAGVEMGGRSIVVDPRGQVMAEAGVEAEILTVDIDPGAALAWRTAFPVLSDRRL